MVGMIPIYTHWQMPAAQYNQPSPAMSATVSQILADVRQRGDTALAHWANHWGDSPPRVLNAAQAETLVAGLLPDDKASLDFAAGNIRHFAQTVMEALKPAINLSQAGARMGARFQPVNSVGCYVPGGRYPLPSSALMTTITAQVAGVPRRVLISPQLGPATVYAGLLGGTETFVEAGGAQALAALAFGTQSLEPVAMVAGPGNAAVVEAKRQLLGTMGIDMLAGPSEVVTLADAYANPDWVAVDLLAQAEHDPQARAFLLTNSPELAHRVQQAICDWHKRLQLPEFLMTSLQHSGLFILPDMATCIKAANQLAPEHLQVMTADPEPVAAQLTDYGALFLGYHTSVPYGDYAAGPNHTLPTARAARFSGALSPLTFLRTQTWLKVEHNATELTQQCARLAGLEGLTAHQQSALCRLGQCER
jgi:histidinol dehydrogenase